VARHAERRDRCDPQLWEIGVRDVKKVWLSDLIKNIRAMWAITDVAELIPISPSLSWRSSRTGSWSSTTG